MSGSELRHPSEYFAWAASLFETTPTSETASAVCFLRGIAPWEYVHTPFGPLKNWQAIALEAVLMAALARENPR